MVIVLLAGAACGVAPKGGPASGTPELNISGVLDPGPMPSCPGDEPCDPPVRAMTLTFSSPSGFEVRVNLSAEGRFAAYLKPGQYAIATDPPTIQGNIVPSTVSIPATGTVFLQLHIVG